MDDGHARMSERSQAPRTCFRPKPTLPLELRGSNRESPLPLRGARARQLAHMLVQLEGALWQAVYAGLDASGPGAQAASVDGDMLRPRAGPQRKVFWTWLQRQGSIRERAAQVRCADTTSAHVPCAQRGFLGVQRFRRITQVCKPVKLRRQRS